MEEKFEGKIVDVDKRTSEKGKTYFYMLVDEAGEEISYGCWETRLFPVVEKLAITDNVKGTYKQSGEYKNIKSIERVGGEQQRITQQPLPTQAPVARPVAVPMAIPEQAIRMQALNFAIQIVLKGMEPGKGTYPTGTAKEIAKEFINFIKIGE